VTREGGVDRLPVCGGQMFLRERKNFLFLAAHVVPVKRRVRLDCGGEVGELRCAAVLVPGQGLFQDPDLFRAGPMFLLEPVEYRPSGGTARAQQREQIPVLLRMMEAPGNASM